MFHQLQVYVLPTRFQLKTLYFWQSIRSKKNLFRDFIQLSDRLEKIPKCACWYYWNFSIFKHLSFLFISLSPSSMSQSKTHILWRSILLKSQYCCSVVQNYDCPIFPEKNWFKKENKIDSSWSSKSNFSLAAGVISSPKVSIKHFTLVEENVFQKNLLRPFFRIVIA